MWQLISSAKDTIFFTFENLLYSCSLLKLTFRDVLGSAVIIQGCSKMPWRVSLCSAGTNIRAIRSFASLLTFLSSGTAYKRTYCQASISWLWLSVGYPCRFLRRREEQRRVECTGWLRVTICRSAHRSHEWGFQEQGSRTMYWRGYSAYNFFISCLFELSFEGSFPAEGKSEIDQFNVCGVLGEEEEVLWFEVAMGYFEKVEIVDCLDHLSEYDSCLLLGETTFLVQSIEELSSFAQAACFQPYSATR